MDELYLLRLNLGVSSERRAECFSKKLRSPYKLPDLETGTGISKAFQSWHIVEPFNTLFIYAYRGPNTICQDIE